VRKHLFLITVLLYGCSADSVADINISASNLAPTETFPFFPDEQRANDLNYKILDNGTVQITRYKGAPEGADIYIPENIDGRAVTVIGTAFLQGCNINRIEIPDSIIFFDDYAFESFTAKFVKCKLDSYAYEQFYHREGNSVDKLEIYTESPYFVNEKRYNDLYYNILDDESVIIKRFAPDDPERANLIGSVQITRYAGYPEGADIVVPEEIDGRAVKVIGMGFLQGCNINSIELPDSVICFDDYAFTVFTAKLVKCNPNSYAYERFYFREGNFVDKVEAQKP
jgi:hypothetical protein